MKHVIVIETPDDETVDEKEFHMEIIKSCELITSSYFTENFIMSRFFRESAVKAVKEIYDIES